MKFNLIRKGIHSRHHFNQTLIFSIVNNTIYNKFRFSPTTTTTYSVQLTNNFSTQTNTIRSPSSTFFKMNLFQHLQYCKKNLNNNKENNKTTTLVFGNETADLDSMVSALFYSYLASITSTDKNRQYIPLINLNREDFKLKTDCIYPIVNYFQSQVTTTTEKNVDYETCSQELVFRDDLTPEILDSFNDLQVVLVDHNRLCYDFEELLSKTNYTVEGIIDHHADEHMYEPTRLKIIDKVGSTVSLITQLYQQEEQKNKTLFEQNPMDTDMAKLFLAPILIDSVNLNRAYDRTTDIDESSADYLKQKIIKKEPDFNFNSYFKLLHQNKHIIVDLSIYDLLRKDFKKYYHHPNPDKTSPENYFYGISSVSRFCIKKLLKGDQAEASKTEILTSMKKWMQIKNLKFLLIMASHLDGNVFKRELFFLFDDDFNPAIIASVIDGIENSDINCTCIQKSEEERYYFFKQKNLLYSRKVLQPFLHTLLGKK